MDRGSEAAGGVGGGEGSRKVAAEGVEWVVGRGCRRVVVVKGGRRVADRGWRARSEQETVREEERPRERGRETAKEGETRGTPSWKRVGSPAH